MTSNADGSQTPLAAVLAAAAAFIASNTTTERRPLSSLESPSLPKEASKECHLFETRLDQIQLPPGVTAANFDSRAFNSLQEEYMKAAEMIKHESPQAQTGTLLILCLKYHTLKCVHANTLAKFESAVEPAASDTAENIDNQRLATALEGMKDGALLMLKNLYGAAIAQKAELEKAMEEINMQLNAVEKGDFSFIGGVLGPKGDTLKVPEKMKAMIAGFLIFRQTLEREKEALEAQVKVLKKQKEVVEAYKKAAKAQIAALEAQKNVVEVEKDIAENERDLAQSGKAEYEAEIQRLTKENKALKSIKFENTRLKAAVKGSENDKLREELRQVNASLEASINENASLKALVSKEGAMVATRATRVTARTGERQEPSTDEAHTATSVDNSSSTNTTKAFHPRPLSDTITFSDEATRLLQHLRAGLTRMSQRSSQVDNHTGIGWGAFETLEKLIQDEVADKMVPAISKVLDLNKTGQRSVVLDASGFPPPPASGTGMQGGLQNGKKGGKKR